MEIRFKATLVSGLFDLIDNSIGTQQRQSGLKTGGGSWVRV